MHGMRLRMGIPGQRSRGGRSSTAVGAWRWASRVPQRGSAVSVFGDRPTFIAVHPLQRLLHLGILVQKICGEQLVLCTLSTNGT